MSRGHASGEIRIPMPWEQVDPEPEIAPIPIDRPRSTVQDRTVPKLTVAIPYRTPLEVAASTSESPDWLLRGYLALGAITEVDGKIKSSGKTTLVTHLVAAILDGQPFLGQPTMRTNVVYLTEQTPGPFREALARAGVLFRGAELRLVFRADVASMAWPDLVAQVAADAKRDGYGLLVVDTLGKLAQVREENDAGEGGRVMAPLQDAAHAGMAVIVCRHERKGGGDVGESGRGSSAISGDVDVILQVRRSEGNVPKSRRVIESLSRYTETPEKIVIELTDEGYILLGDDEAVSLADGVRILSALLHEQFGQKETWTTDELAQETGMSRTAIQRAVREMRLRGEKVDEFTDDGGKARRAHPLMYRLVRETVSAHTHGLLGQKETEGPE